MKLGDEHAQKDEFEKMLHKAIERCRSVLEGVIGLVVRLTLE